VIKKRNQHLPKRKKRKKDEANDIVINESESSHSEDIPRNKSRKQPIVGGTYSRTKSEQTHGRSLVRRKNHNPSGAPSPAVQKVPSVIEIFVNQPEKPQQAQPIKEEKASSPTTSPVSPNRKGRSKKKNLHTGHSGKQ